MKISLSFSDCELLKERILSDMYLSPQHATQLGAKQRKHSKSMWKISEQAI